MNSPISFLTVTPTSSHDARLILAGRGLRQFAYGLLAVVLAVSLADDGFDARAIGVLITVSLLGDFTATFLIGRYADAWGRRRTLVVLALIMAATGALFGLTRHYPLLLFAAFFGTLGTNASETAPFLPIDQAMLPQTSLPARRTALFARYNLVASFATALGALAAGLPVLLARLGVPTATGIRLLFGLYAAAALLAALLAARLSPAVEAVSPPPSCREEKDGGARPRSGGGGLGASRGIVLRLAALFTVDALAGGLAVQSLLALYFHERFGTPLATLGALFFGVNILSALSYLAAVPLARRFGLLNTMVFTHLPSNLLLALIPLMPVFPLAALVLLLRQVLSQMDVPTRQAYTMALVAPAERTAAASVTSLARSAGAASTPILAGVLLQGPLLALGLPFILAGALKAAYDLTLWAVFRRVHLPEE